MLPNPEGPWTQIVYTLALKSSLFRFCQAKVYTNYLGTCRAKIAKDLGPLHWFYVKVES